MFRELLEMLYVPIWGFVFVDLLCGYISVEKDEFNQLELHDLRTGRVWWVRGRVYSGNNW
jgi:hypothetical protein